MKLGELKLQTLELIGVNDVDLSLNNIADYYDVEDYRDYLSRMSSSITRALGRFRSAGVIPTKSHALNAASDNAKLRRFKLRELIPDFGRLKRVCLQDGDHYIDRFPFSFEGHDVLILKNTAAESVPILIYEPKIPVYTPNSSDMEELPLPDELCAMIPHYVKADIYEEDEPELAAQSRNIFEAMLDGYEVLDENEDVEIERTYTAGW